MKRILPYSILPYAILVLLSPMTPAIADPVPAVAPRAILNIPCLRQISEAALLRDRLPELIKTLEDPDSKFLVIEPEGNSGIAQRVRNAEGAEYTWVYEVSQADGRPLYFRPYFLNAFKESERPIESEDLIRVGNAARYTLAASQISEFLGVNQVPKAQRAQVKIGENWIVGVISESAVGVSEKEFIFHIEKGSYSYAYGTGKASTPDERLIAAATTLKKENPEAILLEYLLGNSDANQGNYTIDIRTKRLTVFDYDRAFKRTDRIFYTVEDEPFQIFNELPGSGLRKSGRELVLKMASPEFEEYLNSKVPDLNQAEKDWILRRAQFLKNDDQLNPANPLPDRGSSGTSAEH